MSQYEILRIKSVGEFRLYAREWDDLYQHATQHLATGRHALVVAYWESFLADAEVEVVCLVDVATGQFVAALPLSRQRLLRVLPYAGNFSNEWSLGFTGLLHPEIQLDGLLLLLHSLAADGYRWLNLNLVSDDNPLVQQLQSLSASGAIHVSTVELFQVGKTLLASTWESFTKDWSKKRRRFIRRAADRLAEVGSYQMRTLHTESLSEAQSAWNVCLEIESQGWKGNSQTNIATNQSAHNFFDRLLSVCHATGELRFYVLELDGKMIAYDLGYLHQRVATSAKVSYHPDYREYSPGHVLNSLVVQDLIQRQEADWIDTVGELNEANSKWCAASYRCLKLEVALDTWVGNTVVKSRDWLRVVKRKFSKPDKSTINTEELVET